MWISCILNDDHKKHNLISIEEAYKREFSLTDESFRKAERLKQNLTDSQSKINELINQLKHDKEVVLTEIKEVFNNVYETIKDYENQLVSKLSKEYIQTEEENTKSIDAIQSQLILFKDLNEIKSKLNTLNKIKFLKWNNKNNELIDQISQSANYDAVKPNITFKKDDELWALSKLIYNKTPFELLTEKNKSSVLYQPQSVGEKLLSSSNLK